ncbi:MAG: Sapep family Mn(2+)-dependent dipeptidase [Oscillospiraceae bacterium]|nr:Sapep family Mn(2+)-dependent dipeptidase [Oscillospiraceae bacterium]
MEFGYHIREYREEILEYLAELIAIPSVSDPNAKTPGRPYGEASARALESILRKGDEMGFSIKNVGNYAGHVAYECGDRDEYAAVLSHVDVVPAGAGWETDPFALTERNGLLYGRGVLDDKGAAVVSLFCLKALKDHGILGKRSLRCIFGAGEEVGMSDLEHYFAEEPLPVFAFTPDGDYGICNREKGILHFTLQGKNNSVVLQSLQGGQVVNAVPDLALAILRCTKKEVERLEEAAKVSGEQYTLQWNDGEGTAEFSVRGRAAHAREPAQGHNAVLHLLDLLGQVFAPETLGVLPSFLRKAVGLETDGRSLDIHQADEPSGPLTMNVGIVRIDSRDAMAGLDIRYPVTGDGDAIIAKLKDRAEAEGLSYRTMEDLKPLYAKEDSPLVSVLSDAYRAATGEEALLYATGGGSYARCIPGRCVAFGPVFPGEPDRKMHQSGEHIDPELFFRHAEICLEAMYRMLLTP